MMKTPKQTLAQLAGPHLSGHNWLYVFDSADGCDHIAWEVNRKPFNDMVQEIGDIMSEHYGDETRDASVVEAFGNAPANCMKDRRSTVFHVESGKYVYACEAANRWWAWINMAELEVSDGMLLIDLQLQHVTANTGDQRIAIHASHIPEIGVRYWAGQDTYVAASGASYMCPDKEIQGYLHAAR